MSKKIEQAIEFNYPLTQKVVRDLKIVTETLGELRVIGWGAFNPEVSPIDVYDRYGVDIDFVNWEGNDIKTVLEFFGMMEEIEEEAIRRFAKQIDTTILKAA